jgi:hypothetical protein
VEVTWKHVQASNNIKLPSLHFQVPQQLKSNYTKTDRRKGKAPEFVSRKVDLPSRQSSNKTNAKIAAKLQKKQLKEEQKLQERERKVASLSRKSDKKSAKTVDPVKGESW